jgi:hypothetical protein
MTRTSDKRRLRNIGHVDAAFLQAQVLVKGSLAIVAAKG